jgi:hypothetical protein
MDLYMVLVFAVRMMHDALVQARAGRALRMTESISPRSSLAVFVLSTGSDPNRVAVCSQAESLVQHLVSDMASEDIEAKTLTLKLKTTTFEVRFLMHLMSNLTCSATVSLASNTCDTDAPASPHIWNPSYR